MPADQIPKNHEIIEGQPWEVAQKSRLPLDSQRRYEAWRRETKERPGSKEAGEGRDSPWPRTRFQNLREKVPPNFTPPGFDDKKTRCLSDVFLVYQELSVGLSFEDTMCI